MGQSDPGLTEFERTDLAESGALLIYLTSRDIHAVRSSVVQMKKGGPPDLDP